MEIADELAAIRRRIEQISPGPALLAARFDSLVGASSARLREGSALAKPPASRTQIERLIDASAAESNLDPALIEAIVQNESGFDSRATSAAGARGLMQLMPATAAGLGVADAYDAAQNIRGGTRYFRALLDRFGSVELAIAAYNAGPHAVERFGGVPPYAQTRDYVRSVLAGYRRRSQHGNLAINARSQPRGTIVP
jgi:soluble lytic murein transglycosylase-like protein